MNTKIKILIKLFNTRISLIEEVAGVGPSVGFGITLRCINKNNDHYYYPIVYPEVGITLRCINKNNDHYYYPIVYSEGSFYPF